jgi:hypothetical protein
MAKTKQFTITVDNRPGAVAEIAKTLGSAKVNILALLGTAQGATGTVQLVAENPKQAKKALDAAHISYKETSAETYHLPNKPGALAGCLARLAARGVNLNSVHASAAKGGRTADVVVTVQSEAATAPSAS